MVLVVLTVEGGGDLQIGYNPTDRKKNNASNFEFPILDILILPSRNFQEFVKLHLFSFAITEI